jgi:hypothetical protein
MAMSDEQHLLSLGPLLDGAGNLVEPGYAFSLLKKYDRILIKAPKYRIKEWDYYYVGGRDCGVALTIADNGYMSLVSVTLLTFGEHPSYVEKSSMHLFSFGKLGLPSDSSEGDLVYEDKKVAMKFLHEDKRRHLLCVYKDFGPSHEEFRADIYLEETTGGNSMVIATPFAKKRHFYYNQKINNLRASGYAKLGEEFYDFNQGSYGVLDWGRGVWTYQNTWYWSSLSAFQNGHTVGWNLGYGFGDTKAASENMLFIDDKSYKLDDVKFVIPLRKNGKDDFMSPWMFRSEKGDIDLTFTPNLYRHNHTDLLLLKSDQNQVFGTFNGKFTVNGSDFLILDLPGFAEKVSNRW